MALPTPKPPRGGTRPGTFLQPVEHHLMVLVVVDIDHTDPAVLRRAVVAVETLAAPLSLVILHRRPGFITSAGLRTSTHRRLDRRQDEVVRAVLALLAERGLDPSLLSVDRVPHARLPLGNPIGQAARAVHGITRGRPVRWFVTPLAPQGGRR